MSYILEALKKAQAERQLGHAPDIHSPVLHAQVPAPARRARAWLWLGGALVLAVGAGGAWWSLQRGAPAAGAATAVLVPAVDRHSIEAAGPASPAAAPAIPLAALPPVGVHRDTAPTAPSVPTAPTAPTAPAASARAGAGAGPVQVPPADLATDPGARAAVRGALARLRAGGAPAAPPVRAGSASEASDAAVASLPTLRQLPESQRQAIPQVTFGGSMYSDNPADRLLLVGKELRHEGDEVAPGLVLERLLPHYAVMNYRGTRYRVAY